MAASEEHFYAPSILPSLAAEKIVSFLHGRDVINLSYTCRFWHDVCCQESVWKAMITTRFGSKAIPEANPTQERNLEFYKRLYFDLAALKLPVAKFDYIMHLGNTYLERQSDEDSLFGEVIRLNSVCWLQLNGKFPQVLPGKYKHVWRMKLDGVYVSGDHEIEFRAKAKEGFGSANTSKWNQQKLADLERNHGTGSWFIAEMGEIEVNEMCDVEVEIYGRIDYWCGGIIWDYVGLKPVRKTKKTQARGKGKLDQPPKQSNKSTNKLCLLS